MVQASNDLPICHSNRQEKCFDLRPIWGQKVGILNTTNSDQRPNLTDRPPLTSATRKTAYQMFSKWPQFFVGLYASIVSWTDIPSDFLRKKLYYCLWFPCICYSVHICSIYLIFLMYFCPFRPSSSKQRTIILHIQNSV